MDQENIFILEFVQKYGDFEVDCVAIFNQTVISEDEVRKVIKAGLGTEDVIMMTRSQYDSIFQGRKEAKE